jgi:DNA polymerase III delta subunit
MKIIKWYKNIKSRVINIQSMENKKIISFFQKKCKEKKVKSKKNIIKK